MATLTTEFWLSVFVPAAASIALVAGAAAKRRFGLMALGVLGLAVSTGWLILGLYVEAVVE